MGRLRNVLDALLGREPALKAIRGGNTEAPAVGGTSAAADLGWVGAGDRVDLARRAGDIRTNSVVALGRNWLIRQFPSCTLQVGTRDGSEWAPIPDHPLPRLLSRPNGFQSSRMFWGGIVDGLLHKGYAYGMKVRDRSGQLREVWWVPNHQITPDWGGPRQIKGYWYQPPNGPRRYVQAWDMVHFRIGADPYRPGQGLSPLAEQVRNIVGLNAGERYTSSVLWRSHAGFVIVPREAAGSVYSGTIEERELIAAGMKIERDLSGENSGGFTVVTTPIDLERAGIGPEEMGLDRILDRPEGMVLAAMGLTAHVLGLPSSQATQTYENARTYNRMAWENGVIPLQDTVAEDALQTQLLYVTDARGKVASEWGDVTPDLLCWWDRSEVAALKEDADQRADRATKLYLGYLATLNESRSLADLPPVPGPEGDLRYGESTPEERETERQQLELALARTAGRADADADPEAPDTGEETDDAVAA